MNMEVQSYIWVLEHDAVRRLGFFQLLERTTFEDLRMSSSMNQTL